MGKRRSNESGFGAVEGILIIAIVALISVAGFMVYKKRAEKPVTSKAVPAAITSTAPTSQPSVDFGKTGDYGMFRAEGYAQTIKVDNTDADCGMSNPGVACPKMDEIFFTILNTSNSRILAYIKPWQYTGIPDNSFAIGCSANGEITYSNSSDTENKKYIITKEDSAKILSSASTRPIQLEITKLKLTGGKDAGNCYSNFTTYKVI